MRTLGNSIIVTGSLLVLVLNGTAARAATWQSDLEGRFDIVETFDELQDWTPGAKWHSGSGCETCASNRDLPKKADGTSSIWGIWNSKGLSFEYTPLAGTFAAGDVITGATSGATATVRKVWNLDGNWYLQLTSNSGSTGTSPLRAGETINSGSKSGGNLKWPLFIANHGPAYTWGAAGKSLVMDLGDNSNAGTADPTMEGIGAQRLGAYFGDGVSGGSGYRKIHVFFMMKISPSFFLACPAGGTGCVQGGYDPVNVVKVFDLMSGFTGVSKWGTAAEAALAGGPNLYRINEYGQNFSIFNFGGGGLSFPQNLFFTENIRVSSSTEAGYDYATIADGRRLRSGTSLDIDSYFRNGEWFGIEVAADIGTKGLSDGSTDFWIYDKNGREMGHFAVSGENRLMYFDHRYNKFVLGGNRLSVSGRTGSIDSRWWIDDVIIDDARIGTSYFQMLAARGGAPDIVVPPIDTAAPSVVITSPAANSTVTGVAAVAVNATDNVGVTKVEFHVNGVMQQLDTVAPFSFSWDTRTSGNGSFILTAKAYDAAGNAGSSAPIPVIVSNSVADTTAPVITSVSPTGGRFKRNSSIQITGSATDAIALSHMTVSVDSVQMAQVNGGAISYSWKAIARGTHVIAITAYDRAGNKAVRTVSITVR